ncbi:MAG: hypothetical protein H6Q89_659 [Myxococcaceae bacterium]|nr:hypothetical protein [Myxococcaceae bacterium]
MSSWKNPVGFVAAQAVRLVAAASTAPERPLLQPELELLRQVYADALDYRRVRIRAPVHGLLGISRRAFVIENTLFIPPEFLPLSPAVLVHELCHVWQHQHGGHAYIADSLHAQLLGDGYRLAKGLAEGKRWGALNCEQQATLLEEAWGQGAFAGGRLMIKGVDRTRELEAALIELRAGRGAGFDTG